jgi:hypothetical protein
MHLTIQGWGIASISKKNCQWYYDMENKKDYKK